LQVMWGILLDYQAAEPAITAALADPAAIKAATARRNLGVRDAAEPDDWLPVSSVKGTRS